MSMVGMHCASLRDSLFAETGLLASQPSLQARATHLFLRAANMAARLLDGDGNEPDDATATDLIIGLDAAGAAVSSDGGGNHLLTSAALDRAQVALDAVSEAFGL